MIWASEFELGIPSIDGQHKVLTEILDKIFDLANFANQIYLIKNESEILEILTELNNYAEYHFKHEEVLFRKYQYLNLEAHVAKHNSFKNYLSEVSLKLKSDFNFLVLMDLCYFINDWIIQHIMIEDYYYVQLLKYHDEI